MEVANNKEIVITRLFNAPRSLVYRAWTDPVQFAKWWGPDGYEIPVCEFDLRPGGVLTIHMSGGGWLMKMDGRFIEVEENKKLVFTTAAFPDEQGEPTHEHLNSVLFEDKDGQTKVTLKVEILRVPEGAAAVEGSGAGWKQSLEKLDQLLSK